MQNTRIVETAIKHFEVLSDRGILSLHSDVVRVSCVTSVKIVAKGQVIYWQTETVFFTFFWVFLYTPEMCRLT